MAELGKISGEITFGPLEINPATVNVLFGETSPAPPIELARQHADSFDRARRRFRSKLRSLGELFGEMTFRALELPLEDLEENHAEARHHYERAALDASRRILELERERELLGDELSTFRSELRDAMHELDRRDRRARRAPDALLLHLHELLAEPIR